MEIADQKVVSIDYTLKDDNGNVIDQSQEGQPMAYLHGSQNIIPGLENALAGKKAGDEVKVRVTPEEGYGERSDAMTQTVPIDLFEDKEMVKEGMQFHAQTDAGVQVVTVTKVEGDQVTVDGNHPLAGMHLNFDVKIADVREATAEELEHGHVHGPGGHEH